jgi:hypothetical protein
MLIDCPRCEAKVDGENYGGIYESSEPVDGLVSLLRCPSCNNAIVGWQDKVGIDHDGSAVYDDAVRVWPEPKRPLDWSIPEIVRISLNEAEKCFRASAYIAAVVMCGRALEGICRHFGTKNAHLSGGLAELRDKEVIDKRLYEWGEELRRHRNIAAHASEKKISKRDAEDLMDFVFAIGEYIFVLNHKFEEFLKRKAKETAKATQPAIPVPTNSVRVHGMKKSSSRANG